MSKEDAAAVFKKRSHRDVELPSFGVVVRVRKLSPGDFIDSGDIPVPEIVASGGMKQKGRKKVKQTMVTAAGKKAQQQKDFDIAKWMNKIIQMALVGIVKKGKVTPVKVVLGSTRARKNEVHVKDFGMDGAIIVAAAVELAGVNIDLEPFLNLVRPVTAR